MRLVVDSLIAVMLTGILGGLLWHHRAKSSELDRMQAVHRALARLNEMAVYKGALLSDPEQPTQRFPKAMNPTWFHGSVPVNVMVPGRQPWLDIAPEGDASDHPPDPVISGGTQAGFWYNPTRGVFRARIQPQYSDRATLDLYNHLNGTALKMLTVSDDASRAAMPLPYEQFGNAVLPREEVAAGDADGSDPTTPRRKTLADSPEEDEPVIRPSLRR